MEIKQQLNWIIDDYPIQLLFIAYCFLERIVT